MKKVRVMHVVPNFGPGGAERLVVDLLGAFDPNRFEVAAASLYPESGTMLEREIREKGIEVFYLSKRRGPDPRMIPQLHRLFCSFRPDVVHTHLYVLRYTLLPTLLSRVPARAHTVHNIAQKEVDGIGKLVHRIAFRLASVVPVSISQEVADTVRATYGRNIHTPLIYNGIPTKQFVSKTARSATPKGKSHVWIHIGRFAPQKNHLLLVEAFALAVREHPEMELWLVGDGPLRAAVEAAVTELDLEAKTSFLGLRADVPQLMASSDALVLSSGWEGLPLTVLEAMAAGKPVVATAVGGVPELVEDGATGILVPPGDAKALAQGLLRLAQDPDLRRRMGRAAQKRAIERFDIARAAREYEALYLRLLDEGTQ